MVHSHLTYNSASHSIKSNNEDAYGWSVDTFWVIDGSTPLDGTSGEKVAEFAHDLSREMHRVFTPENNKSMASNLFAAHHLVLDKWAMTSPSDIPTASLIVARLTDSAIDIYALGDCTALIAIGDCIDDVIDSQFAGNEQRHISRIGDYVKRGMSAESAYREIETHLRHERTLRNTSLGKWILGGHPDAALHGHRQRLALDPDVPVRIALMSDGYRRALDVYGLYPKASDFLNAIAEDPDEPIRRSREIEAADPTRERYIRLTAQDDATVVSVRRP
jgi:hypothetical protein